MERRVRGIGLWMAGGLHLVAVVGLAACYRDGRETRPEGAAQLALLEAEPVLAYRAPETELDTSSSVPAGVDHNVLGPDKVVPTSVNQTFGVSGDPARAIEAYLAEATASGWRLVETACSRPERISTAVLIKDFPGFTANLVLTGYAPLPPAPRRLMLELAVKPLPAAAGERGFGPQPGSLHCVRQVKSDDPDLRPPSSAPARTPAELCALLPLAEARAADPRVQRAVAEISNGIPGCAFRAPHRVFEGRETTWIALSDAFETPKAVYLDRRHPASQADESLYLLTSDVGPSLSGAWIATPRGPVELHVAADLDVERTLALARVVQARARAQGG